MFLGYQERLLLRAGLRVDVGKVPRMGYRYSADVELGWCSALLVVLLNGLVIYFLWN